MSCSLNSVRVDDIGDFVGFRVYGLHSLKGGYMGDYVGSSIRLNKGDTRTFRL